MSCYRTTLLVIPMLAGSASAMAQSQAPVDFTGRLGPTSVVRATLPDGSTRTGRITALGAGRVAVLNPEGAADTLELARIQTVEVRGRHTKTGALIGAAVGLASGLFVGYMVNGLCDSANCADDEPYLVTIPFFGGGGTLLGAIIGAAIPKWNRVYP